MATVQDLFNRGAAACVGVIRMAEAIAARSMGACAECGYDQSTVHPNADYDGWLYPCSDGRLYCGACADRLGKQDHPDLAPLKRSTGR